MAVKDGCWKVLVPAHSAKSHLPGTESFPAGEVRRHSSRKREPKSHIELGKAHLSVPVHQQISPAKQLVVGGREAMIMMKRGRRV